MEHVFKIGLFPLTLLVYQYFLETSQFWYFFRAVLFQGQSGMRGLGAGRLNSHEILTMLCDVGIRAALASGDRRAETLSSMLGNLCLQAIS